MHGAQLTTDYVPAQLQASDDDIRIAALATLTADDLQSSAVSLQWRIALQSPSVAIRVAALKAGLRCGYQADVHIQACIHDRDTLVRVLAFRLLLQWARPNRLDICHRGLIDRSSEVRLGYCGHSANMHLMCRRVCCKHGSMMPTPK
jgi:hypothetical protein